MLSLPDMLIVGGAALLVFGPKRLPEVANALGRSIRDFKKAMTEDDTPPALPPATDTVVDHEKRSPA